MKYPPDISVILPNYNYARFLHKRIKSILQQTHEDFELIILDDASDDQSWEIIEKYRQQDSRIRAFQNQHNTGNPFKQWQQGISKANFELIWIAEADDVAAPELLEILIECIRGGDVGLAFCKSVITNVDGHPQGFWEINSPRVEKELLAKSWVRKGKEMIAEAFIHENIIGNSSSVLFSKKIYKRAGGVCTALPSNADWHLWLRMAMHTQVAYENKALNYFRRHSESVIFRTGKDKDSYQEKYDLTLRRKLRRTLRMLPFRIRSKSTRQNRKYISYDLGNKALWHFSRGESLRGLPALIHASMLPYPTLGYLRRVISVLRKSKLSH